MTDPAEKARALRVARIKSTLENKIENPQATLEQLIAELEAGDPQLVLWETFHAAAPRDGVKDAVAAAYAKMTSSQRMSRLALVDQASVLMHAADFAQGIAGDLGAADGYLERVLKLVPGHAEAFGRLEKRLETQDPRRALEIYAHCAIAPPLPALTLATMAVHKLVMLRADAPLSDEACKKLVMLVATAPRLLQALEQHCKLTKRPALACTLYEEALLDPTLGVDIMSEHRHRLLELYMVEGAPLENAIGHVEELLKDDPTDAIARKAAERLLGVREIASRAAAALAQARRSQPPPPSRSQPPKPSS